MSMCKRAFRWSALQNNTNKRTDQQKMQFGYFTVVIFGGDEWNVK